ncbi:MAG: hypothetical protein WD512_03695, partial [Candidatus Paceibacterota bacterium]
VSLYFAYHLNRKFLFPLYILLAIINIIAVVYTLQHYVVDIFLAFIISIIVIFLSNKLIHSSSNKLHFYFVDILQTDFQNIGLIIKDFFQLIRKK